LLFDPGQLQELDEEGPWMTGRCLLLSTIACLSLSAAAGAQSEVAPDAVRAIEQANAEWLPAIKAGDAARIAAPYAENGVFVLPDGSIIKGRQAVEAMYARRSASRSQIVDGGITSCGRLASAPGQVLEWGYGRATARAADGATKTSGGPYVTWWRKAADGTWRIERNLAFAAPVPENADPCLDAASHAFDEAQFRHSTGAIATFLSPELVYVRGSGAAADKAAFIEGFADAGVVFDPFVIKDRRVIMLGPDAAVVAGDGLISGTDGGKRFSDHFRYADTFRRRGGRWEVAYVQVTRIP
jgi:uncharacterized protein (TIGR02246 family)